MSTAYDEWAARRDASRQGRVKAVIEGAPPVAPQQASEIDSLSREFGVPSEVIRADPDIFKRQREVARAAQTVDSAPRLGDWLTRGEMNAAKAKDSLPQLSHVEAALKAPLARPPEWFKLPEGADLGAYMTGPAAVLTRWLQPKIERGIEGTINTAHDAWQSGEFRWKDAAKSLGAGFGDIGAFGLGLAEIGARHNLYAGGAVNPQNEENAQVFGAIGDRLQAWADEFGPKANNQAVADVYSGVRSIPFSAAAVLSGGLAGSARVGASTVGALTGGGSYRRGKAEGLSEGQALFYGTIDAGIETGTEIGPLAKIFGHVGSGTSFGKKLWQSFLSEIPNEQIATLGQDFNQWAMIDAAKGKTFNDFLAERWDAAKSTAIATIIGSGTVLSATHAMEKVSNRVAVRFQRAENAARTEQLVTRLEEIAKAAPIAVRDPESFAEFVKHAADGTEATDVFIAADKLAEVFEQSGLNEEQIAQALPGVPEQFKTAVLTGGDIRIPIEDLAARSGDLAQAMTKHLRLDPNDMSQDEAKTFMQSVQDEIAAETEAMFEKVAEGNSFRAEIDQVRQQVADELNAAGRFTPETHTAYAALYGNFFGRLAQDLGESPLAVAERYGLKVRAEGVAAPEVLDQKFSRDQLERMDIDRLDRAAFGYASGDIVEIDPAKIKIKYPGDLENPEVRFAKEGMDWVNSVSFDEPVEVSIDNEGEFSLEDGHHRLFAAQKLGRALRARVEVKGKPIEMLLRKQNISPIDALLDPTLPAQVAAFRNWFGELGQNDALYAAPIEDLPEHSPGPFMAARVAAARFAERIGLSWQVPTNYAKLSVPRAKRIAAAYEEMQHDPNNEEVRDAYDAMIGETLVQWQAIKETGLTVEFAPSDADPYEGNPWGAVRDVRENNHLFVFNTEDGYGEKGITDRQRAENPMLARVEGESWSGRPVLVNDVFRAVHDYFGHIKEGVGFRAQGEENAWRIHSLMYSPLARRAMTTETRGQNSWLNYGPYGETNRKARVEDTVFAEQKIGLLPEWVMREGAGVDKDAETLASWTPNRISALLKAFGYGHEDNKTKGWGVRMTPDQFLGLTASAKGRAAIDAETGTLDRQRLEAEVQPIYLIVEYTPERQAHGPTEDGKGVRSYTIPASWRAVGHEGRHRMTALKNAGVQSVPVVVLTHGQPAGDYQPMVAMEIKPQRSKSNGQMGMGDTIATVHGLEPLSYANRGRLEHAFGEPANVFFQDEDTFYSALLRAIETHKQGKATPAEWKGILANTPGVKPDEILWSGLNDLLDLRAERDGPKTAITREELAYLMQSRGIVVREVVLDGQSPEVDDDYVWQLVQENREDFEANGFDAVAEGLVGSVVRETFGTHPDLFDGETDILGPRYFALDGEGNRLKDDEGNDSFETREEAEEVVEAWEDEATKKFWEKWEEQETELVREHEEEYLRESSTEAEGAAQFAAYTTDPDSESYRELLLTLPPGEGKNPKRAPSTHWDPDGVVAHLRFMEKHHADGSPVLFIEEVQSDWHQKGRDEGYEQPADPAKIAEAQAKYDAAVAEHENARVELYRVVENVIPLVKAKTEDARARMLARFDASKETDPEAPAIWAKTVDSVLTPVPVEVMHPLALRRAWDAATSAQGGAPWTDAEEAEIIKLRVGIENENVTNADKDLAGRELDIAKGLITNGGVPLAPFQKSWPELVMKRAIRWAVDNGYKRIAWTTGQQQADRYNLSEAVGRIELPADEVADEGKVLFLEDRIARLLISNGHATPTGRERSRETGVLMTEAQVKEVFGGDLGGRIVAGTPGTVFEGEDLQVGGEGMKAFYDRNLVNITNSLIKKHGGKVAPMPIREFGGTSGELAAKRIVADIGRSVGAESLDQQTVLNAIDKRLAQNTPEALAERWAQHRAELEYNITELRAVIEDKEHPGRVEAAVPAYKNMLVKREAELAAFDKADGSAEEERRQRVVALLEGQRKTLTDIAEGKLPPGKDTNFGFEITPKLAEVAAGGFPLFQKTGKSRGQIAFGEDITETPSVITLLRSANLSTFLHETGHFFLQVSIDVASRPDAPERVLKDVDTFFKWTGVRGLTEWNAMGIDEQREHHERFARGFEAYLMEGKAPSLELRSLFATFRSWLLSVYQSLTRLNVTLTDEVRSVFDRMLATDSEIEEAQHDFGFQPAFSEKPPAMTDAEWENYQALGADAQREAASQLERRSLNDMRYGQRAMGRALKAAQKSVDGLRKATRQEVAADVAGEPVYRAMAFMRSGKLNGVAWDGPTKINIESLEALYEDKPVLYANEIKARLRGMTAADGLNVNQIAELFGFTSGDHMVQEILLAPPIRDAIEGEVDQRMLERYGDLTSPQAVEAAAIKAVHNDVRGRFIATEMRMATGAVGKPRLLAAAAKRFAEDAIARVKVRNLRPAQYEAAERRANSAAVEALAADDLAKFGAEKRNQLVNFYGARVARDALDEVRSILKYLTKFEKAGTRKALDPDYTDQIDAMLERFDLRVSTTNKQADKRKSLASWVERMKDMGFEPVISDKLLDEANRTPYRELTVEELRGLRDAVKNIEHLGRLKKKLLTAKDQRDFADAVNDITDEIETNAFKTVVQPVGARTWLEGVKGHFDDFVAMHRKLANFTYIMGGNKYGGALWTRIMLPLNEAGDRETVMKQDAMLKLRDLFSVLKDDNLTKKTYEPGIDDSISLETRLLVALNWGNEGNRQRIMDGDKWTEDQVNAILAPLTETHWRFVQSVWDYINGFWPEIAAKERRVTGIVPEKVEALPFEMNGVQMRGGYFPIKYDPARSAKAEADTAAEVLQQMLGGKYTNAQTRRGHTKARVENVDRPLRKDFGVIFGHVNQVIHDLTHHEALIDANRLLRAAGVDGAIRGGYGPAAARWMREALNDIAVGDIPAQNGLEVIWNYLRTGATTAGLGWNLWTSLLQPIGLTQSMSRIGSKWIGRGIAELFKDPAKMNAKIEWIYAQSDFMRHRGDTMQREIAELRNQISAKSPLRRVVEKAIPAEAVDAVQGSFFYMIGKAQLMADLPTWLGQYEKSIDAGKDPETAARIADQAVIDSQGSGMIKDLAGVQRGPALMKLWTNFYSYFSATYNLMADRVGELRRVGPSDLPYFAVDFALLSIIPATLTALLYHFLKGDDDDSLWSEIVNQNLSYMTGTMMMTREIGAIFAGNTGYTGPAGARLFDAISKFSVQVKQGEADEALARSANTVFGILLHYPAAQIDRTVRGTTAFANGEAGPAAPIVGPPPR